MYKHTSTVPEKILSFPDRSAVNRSSPRLVAGPPRLVIGTPRYSQVHQQFTLALQGIPKLITITPLVFLFQSSEIPVALLASQNALLGTDTLLKLMHQSIYSTSSQTHLEAPRDYNTIC
jgi:hypothetical protein